MYRVFGYYLPRSLVVLSAAEITILLVSAYVGAAFQLYDFGIGPSGEGPMWMRAVSFCALMLIVMTATGLYQRDLRDRGHTVVIKIIASFALASITMTSLDRLIPDAGLGVGAFIIALLCSGVGILACRLIYFHDIETTMRQRVLVLGVGKKARLIEELRRKADRRGVAMVGFVDVEKGPRLVTPAKIVPPGLSIQYCARRFQIDEIVVAVDDRRNKLPLDELLNCKMSGIRVIELSEFLERQLRKLRVDSLQPGDVVFSNGFSRAVITPGAKRLLDVTLSSAMLIMTFPLIGLAALAILIESKGRGPIIYRQVRVGRNGRHFQVLKLRSMRVDAERDGVVRWAQRDDDRITTVGAFMRKTRIDELPQLFNVLKGDMSFIGPRPERPAFVKQLEKKIPYFGVRHYVKPGITGWAQICYPYGHSEEDAKEKLEYDLYYLKNYSLFLDLTILIQTVQIILWGKGR
ncbi:MAG: TIGR03013 family XrtA/PEP-CTERM system glycosyltransferase [Gammaproteobacteria bacterium]